MAKYLGGIEDSIIEIIGILNTVDKSYESKKVGTDGQLYVLSS